MRVPNKILFDTSRYRLGNLSSEMYKANETVTTGKRIQGIGDDPVGLSQVMNLKSSVSSMAQLDKNIGVGKTWLNSTDAGLESLKDLITQVNQEVSQLISASSGPQQRSDAVARVDSLLRQVVDIGNTRVNGRYIFGGSRTETPPFIYNDSAVPPSVSYEGDHEAFRIRTGENKAVEVGRDGSTVFYTDHVAVNSTNNTLVFQEDRGLGSAFRKTMTVELPTGDYSGKSLALEVEKRMNALSSEEGYGLDYAVTYDAENQSFSIRETSGAQGEFVRTEILWKTGGEPRIENAGVTGEIPAESLQITLKNPDALTRATEADTPMRLVWDGKDSFIVKDNPGYVLPSKLTPVDGRIALDLTDSGVADVEITLDMETIQSGDSIFFSLVPFKGNTSIGREMGFYEVNTSLNPPTGSVKPAYITEMEIDASNLNIDFAETDALGNRVQVTAALTPGVYDDMAALTAEIKTAMEAVSPNGTSYAVSYDAEKSRFFIREDGGSLTSLELLWRTGPSAGLSSSGESFGFDVQNDVLTYPQSSVSPVLFKITSENNRLNFEETVGAVDSGALTAVLPAGSYRSMADFETALSDALNLASANGITYTASYDPGTRRFSITDDGGTDSVTFLWGSGADSGRSIASVLGYEGGSDVTIAAGSFPYQADADAVLFTVDSSNGRLDFQEVDEQGEAGDPVSIVLPEKEYADPLELAADIQTRMREASPSGIAYVVGYDAVNNRFSIRGGGEGVSETRLLWKSGPNADRSLAETLGFDPQRDAITTFPASDRTVVRVTVDGGNNKLDFREVMQNGDHEDFCELTARIPEGVYTDMADLARAVERAMESESRNKGFGVAYTVSHDAETGKFSIREEADRLHSLDLLFESGANRSLEKGGTGQSAAGLLGFDAQDRSMRPMESNREVEWSLFRTLNDLMADLADNDVSGLEQGLQRLETSFKHLNSLHADTGIRYNRLEIQEKIQVEMKLSLTERKSEIEDADMIEAIMNLQSRELAYQAAMSSTAKIMKMSIMDYL